MDLDALRVFLKVAELGKALADFHRNHTEDDMKKILEYALKHRQMDEYPHDIADMLEAFAKQLRKLIHAAPDLFVAQYHDHRLVNRVVCILEWPELLYSHVRLRVLIMSTRTK